MCWDWQSNSSHELQIHCTPTLMPLARTHQPTHGTASHSSTDVPSKLIAASRSPPGVLSTRNLRATSAHQQPANPPSLHPGAPPLHRGAAVRGTPGRQKRVAARLADAVARRPAPRGSSVLETPGAGAHGRDAPGRRARLGTRFGGSAAAESGSAARGGGGGGAAATGDPQVAPLTQQFGLVPLSTCS